MKKIRMIGMEYSKKWNDWNVWNDKNYYLWNLMEWNQHSTYSKMFLIWNDFSNDN